MAASSSASFAVLISLLLGLLQSHEPDILLGQFRGTGILVIERGGQVCQDMVLEHKGPGLMPLSGVIPLYNSVVADLNGGQLEFLCLERRFPNIFRLERWLHQADRGSLWLTWSLVQRGPWFNATLGLAG